MSTPVASAEPVKKPRAPRKPKAVTGSDEAPKAEVTKPVVAKAATEPKAKSAATTKKVAKKRATKAAAPVATDAAESKPKAKRAPRVAKAKKPAAED